MNVSHFCLFTGRLVVEESNDDGPKMPSLDSMLEGRENMEAYSYFAYYFLPIVVGKHVWRKRFEAKKNFNDLASTSDEAFGLLLLDNSWDRWKFLKGKDKQAIKEANDRGELPRTKFSTGKAGDHKRNHGWDYEGLKRFQDLGAIVRNDKNRGEEEQLHEGWTEIFYNIVAEKYMEQEQQTDAREEPEQVVQELSLWFD